MALQAHLIAAVVVFALGVGILIRNPKNLVYQLYAGLAGATGLIFLSVGFISLTNQLFWLRTKFLGFALLIPILISFTKRFPDPIKEDDDFEFYASLTLSFFCLLLAFLPKSILLNQISPKTNLLTLFSFFANLAVFLAMVRSSQHLLKQFHQTKHQIRQTRLKLLLMGSGITIFCVLLQQLPNVPPLGMISVVLFLYFLAQALIHYRLLDLQEILGRGLIFAVEILLFSFVFWIFGFWGGSEGAKGDSLTFNSLLAVTVILLLYEPLHRLISTYAKSLFFHQQLAFEQLLQNARDDLPSQGDQEKTVQFVIEKLKASGRVSHASLYLMEEDFNVFRLKNILGEDSHLPPVISNQRLIRYLKDSKRPLILENEQQNFETQEIDRSNDNSLTVTTLATLEAQLSLPLITSSGHLMGILNLKDRTSDEAYTNSEIRLLMTLAGQLATVLHSLKLYNQLIEKDRLLALGEMAAGLAHEIRNPLGAIKGAAQYLKSGSQKDTQKANKFLGIIMEESDRLNEVVEQFLDFARLEKVKRRQVDINHILKHTLDLVKAKGISNNLEVVLDLQKDLPRISLDGERMKQVFLNLALNAIQAMPKGGKLEITSKMLNEGQMQICFNDSGPGLPKEESGRIFAPFFTTKDKGTGLGLAICKRVVTDHGGEIKVKPQGKLGGASFQISLNVDSKEVAKT